MNSCHLLTYKVVTTSVVAKEGPPGQYLPRGSTSMINKSLDQWFSNFFHATESWTPKSCFN